MELFRSHFPSRLDNLRARRMPSDGILPGPIFGRANIGRRIHRRLMLILRNEIMGFRQLDGSLAETMSGRPTGATS